MDVFGHDDVSEDPQAISAPDTLERGDKGIFCMGRVQERSTAITGEGDEMRVSGLVEALESSRHAVRLLCGPIPLKPKPGLSGAPRNSGDRVGVDGSEKRAGGLVEFLVPTLRANAARRMGHPKVSGRFAMKVGPPVGHRVCIGSRRGACLPVCDSPPLPQWGSRQGWGTQQNSNQRQ